MRSLESELAKLSKTDKAKIKHQLEELERLRDLYSKKRTQVAAAHKITDIPAFEQTADEFIAAMRECVQEMGGNLRMVLELNDADPIDLEGIADLGTDD